MTYVVSNLHGDYDKFTALLQEIKFKDSDLMYILGDIVDYGDQSMELIADLSVRLNVYAVAGEHDYRAARMLTGRSPVTITTANKKARIFFVDACLNVI